MKQNHFHVSLLLLASSVVKCAAAPHNGTASLAPRMNPASQSTQVHLEARMRQLYETGGCWIDDMISPADYDEEDERDLDRGHARVYGWTRNDKTGWHWMESEQDRRYFVPATQAWEHPTMWSYHGLYHRVQRAIVILKAYSDDLNTTPNELPPENEYLPVIHEWGQMTWMEYRQGQARASIQPVRVLYFPALQGYREDVGLFRYVAGHFTRTIPLRPKPGATFPIGSYGHQILLGSVFGVQVSKLLFDSKLYTEPAVVVSISIWDSGLPGGQIPSVLYNIDRYDSRVRRARPANIDAGREQQWFTEWPYKFLPNFLVVSSISAPLDDTPDNQESHVEDLGAAHNLDALSTVGIEMMAQLQTPLEVSQAAQRPSVSRSKLRSVGWKIREGILDEIMPSAIQDFTGYRGLHGVQNSRSRPTDFSHPIDWNAAKYTAPVTGLTYEPVYNKKQRTLIVTYARSHELNISPDLRLTLPTNAKDMDNQLPPQLIYFPRVEWVSDTGGVILSLLGKLQFFMPTKPGIIFPVGSFGYKVLLGPETGTQVAKFLLEHERKFALSVILSVHIWTTGDGCSTPAMTFSCGRDDRWMREAADKNSRHHGSIDYP
ncbi:hypothetical protein DOTSEDRAFT_27621 [Dothistroma septosporum NZE10]|uniref:Tyrosinase copper-binding domain-containing protein n=1 Tax=Dothistroma septosporum (strain NZE10 / CBS 128990) TaxID=675120 RepID=N1PF76_DOTSN|nr:hypothetical protein DOTSEDRAFT_27621 [Dothistroma septosporum NZE10]